MTRCSAGVAACAAVKFGACSGSGPSFRALFRDDLRYSSTSSILVPRFLFLEPADEELSLSDHCDRFRDIEWCLCCPEFLERLLRLQWPFRWRR